VRNVCAAAAGGVFVPVNPVLKPAQVAYILKDCDVRILVTSAERLNLLAESLGECEDLRAVMIVGSTVDALRLTGVGIVSWKTPYLRAPGCGRTESSTRTDRDSLLRPGRPAAPKGSCCPTGTVVAGAKSVAQYLENHEGDRILSALPLSFDAGFSQLTTAFMSAPASR